MVSAQGVVVAHATKEISSTGANVAFLPCFKNAMGGAANVDAAVGSVSSERSLFDAALGSDSLAIEAAINRFNFEQALAELRQACVNNAIEI